MYRPLSLDLKTNEGGRYCNNQREMILYIVYYIDSLTNRDL